MSDLEKATRELGTKAAFAAAKRALDDALLSDEEREKRRAEQDALARRKRRKRIAQVAIGALLVVGLVGLMLHYWYWALLLGFISALGLYVRHRFRNRARKKPEAARVRAEPLEARVEAPVKARIAPPAASVEEPDSSIEDDLAALKARIKK